LKQKIKQWINVFLTFLKISSFTFGGGFAILPLLKYEAVEKNKWITEEELYDIFAASQLVPGLIYVSSATFIGYRVCGIIGAMLATIAVLIPSAAAIMVIATLLKNYFNNVIIQKLFLGIICGVTAMTVLLFKDLSKNYLKSFISIIIFLISFVLIQFFNIKAIFIIIGAIVLGIVISLFRKSEDSSNA
jgi:chromate transporter